MGEISIWNEFGRSIIQPDQEEKREIHFIDGKAVSYEEMRKMGYSKYKCGKFPNRRVK